MVPLDTALYVIGPRAAEMLANVLTRANFQGVLMSDGYAVCRDFANRLRRSGHLARKAKGLAESNHPRVAQVGRQIRQHVDELMQAVYAARQAKARQQPPASRENQLAAFRQLCDQYQNTSLPWVSEVAREFLNDWDTIMRQLAEPHLPLSRTITVSGCSATTYRSATSRRHALHGRYTAYAWLASLSDTCRLCGASALQALAATIAAARKGLPLPPLPPIPDRLRGWDALAAC